MYYWLGLHTYILHTNLHRKAWGHLPTILLVWPTSARNSHSEATQRANPEEPTLSGPQVAPITRPKSSRWEG